MIGFLLLAIGCGEPRAPPEPPPPPPPLRALGVLSLIRPPSLPEADCLQLAALEANLGEVEDLVVELDGERTPAHRYAPAQAQATATVRGGAPLRLEVCVEQACATHSGDAKTLAMSIASQLNRTFDPRLAWALPDTNTVAARKMRRAASVHFGLHDDVYHRRLGSKWDPVAQGPREEGATALAAWLQGRRDLRKGRARLAADVLATIRRDTLRSRFDTAVAYLDAGWHDEAWERVRHAEVDRRTHPVTGHIAALRGRTDVVETVIESLPAHPERARLRFVMDPTPEAADAWREAWPADKRAQRAVLESALDNGGGGLTGRLAVLAEQLGTLEAHLIRAEDLSRKTAVLQNQFGEARREGPLPCDHPAQELVAGAAQHGEEHRIEVNQAREVRATLEVSMKDNAPEAVRQRVERLQKRLAAQLRAAKVLRSYQQKVLLGRTCVRSEG